MAFVTPYYWLFTSAFKSLPDIQKIPPEIVPLSPTLENFAELIKTTYYGQSLLNSLYVGIITTICALFICSLAGFAFAKLRFPGREKLFLIMLVTMMIPSVVLLIPTFIIMTQTALIDTFWSLILISIAPPFGIFWMRQYISAAIHNELIEAALIDGAGYFQVYWKVVLPLITPALASLAIFIFTLSWNSFLQPLTFLKSPEKLTYPVQLVAMQSITFPVRPTHLIMAGATLSVAPILVLYIFLQRFFVSGITAGAVKE
ncbi:MAG: carbohydrate ABC transporter permease [Anaerolineae bacterium]